MNLEKNKLLGQPTVVHSVFRGPPRPKQGQIHYSISRVRLGRGFDAVYIQLGASGISKLGEALNWPFFNLVSKNLIWYFILV